MANKDELFYKEKPLSTIERIVLAEDVELPDLQHKKRKLTFDFLKKINPKPYKLVEEEYWDVYGKFFIQILTPTMEKEINNPIEEEKPPIRAATKGNELHTKEYKDGDFVEIRIPKFIMMNFRKKILAGTEFLAASIGGALDVDKMCIIGVYKYPEPKDNGDNEDDE